MRGETGNGMDGMEVYTVNPPLSERLSINLLVSQTRWVSGTCGLTGTAINADFETEVVDLRR